MQGFYGMGLREVYNGETMMRGKRWEDGWLTAYWSKKERDIEFGSPCRPDGRLLYGALGFNEVFEGKTLIDELKQRGYDITTLQFSVKRKYKPNEEPA